MRHHDALHWFSPHLRWYATLAALLLLMAVAIGWAVRVWREARGDVEACTDTAEDLLAPLREAYDSGQMSEEEYRRLREAVLKVAPPGKLSDLGLVRPGPSSAGAPGSPAVPDGPGPSGPAQ